MKKINFKNVLAAIGVCAILVTAVVVALQTYANYRHQDSNIVEDDLAPF